MTIKHHILLAGSTGLVGSIVRSRLATLPYVDTTALVRHGSSTSGSEIDFEQMCAAPEAALRRLVPDGIDVAISCLGTTIRTAGSQQAMFRVDHDYVLAVAKGARALGARQFILMSSVGAGGPGFYLKTKGAIERDITYLRFDRLDLIRPGVLEGGRNEERPLEDIGGRLFKAVAAILPSSLERFGPIRAETVAEAIVGLVSRTEQGNQIHYNADIRSVADASRMAANTIESKGQEEQHERVPS